MRFSTLAAAQVLQSHLQFRAKFLRPTRRQLWPIFDGRACQLCRSSIIFTRGTSEVDYLPYHVCQTICRTTCSYFSSSRTPDLLDILRSLQFVCSFIYDHIVCFPDEVELMWKSRWGLAKVIYLFNRYFSLISICLNTTGI
ncbi:hypothetical protein C8J57DRAFT_611006 [Mycena rebaudengoi]|nr:hypothetical protein C8J57DRAFT_611006 [Mycena rebaudengoi]